MMDELRYEEKYLSDMDEEKKEEYLTRDELQTTSLIKEAKVS